MAHTVEDTDSIPWDVIHLANHSVELHCLLQAAIEKADHDSSNTSYCPTTFDTILCWPRTLPGSLAYVSCMEEFNGLQYDSSGKFFILLYNMHNNNFLQNPSNILSSHASTKYIATYMFIPSTCYSENNENP